MVATDAVALYPSLEKYETARRISRFIKESGVNFEDINVSEALVYLKLNEDILKKQGSFKEVRGFLPTPKNGKKKHMTHPMVRGPHTTNELKKLDEESTEKRNSRLQDRNQ